MSEKLDEIAAKMVAPGQGILAADESGGTIKKRFDQIGVVSTEDSRRDYREMLFRAGDALRDNIPESFSTTKPSAKRPLTALRSQS
jgi:fructose-bisphosphate aldolase class I